MGVGSRLSESVEAAAAAEYPTPSCPQADAIGETSADEEEAPTVTTRPGRDG
jgi:hypothetical protein